MNTASQEWTEFAPDHIANTNPQRFAYLIGLRDRYTFRTLSPLPRWPHVESMRRAYLMGYTRDFSRTPLPLP